MTEREAPDLNSREFHQQLFDSGWQQGRLFTLEGAAVLINVPSKSGGIEVKPRPVKPDQQLVVASQACDIVSPQEPNIEALVCRQAAAGESLESIRNSSRLYPYDFKRGLIVDARARLLINKRALANATLSPYVPTVEDTEGFAYWLARRSDRPAIDPETYEAVWRPLYDEAREAQLSDPALVDLFQRAVREVRIGKPYQDGATRALQMLIVLEEDGVEIDEAEAIQEINHRWSDRLRGKSGIRIDVQQLPYSEVYAYQIDETLRLALDNLSEFGEQLPRLFDLAATETPLSA
jgi:hypothetical protein